MAKKLLNPVKKAILIGTAILFLGCPLTQTSPKAILKLSKTSGVEFVTSNIELTGETDENNFIKEYQLSIDKNNDGTIDEIITETTNSIGITRNFCAEKNRIYGKCIDSHGLESTLASEDITVTPLQTYPGPKTKIAFSERDEDKIPSSVNLWIGNSDGSGIEKIFEGIDYRGRVKFSPNGESLAFEIYHDKYKVIDLKGNITHEFEVGGHGFSNDFVWTPEGNSILFSSYYQGIYKYNLLNKSVEKIITSPLATFDHNSIMSPDLKKIAYTHHEYGTRYYIFVTNGENKELITNGISGHDKELNLDWIDNKNLVWKVNGNENISRIYHANIESKTVSQISSGIISSEIELSPGKKELAIYGQNIGFISTAELLSGSNKINKFHTSLNSLSFLGGSSNGDYFLAKCYYPSRLRILDKQDNPYRFISNISDFFQDEEIDIQDVNWSSKILQ